MPGGFVLISGGLANWQSLAAFLLLLIWFVAEILVRARAVAKSGFAPGERRDRGSAGILIALMFVAIIGSGLASQQKLELLPNSVFYAGISVMAVGIVVRTWAISHLGRYFSPVVRTSADHQIIRTGPYRRVRHPSYTGMVLAILGYSIALTSAVGIALTVAALAIGIGYRIHVEEVALTERFGEEYRAYARSTWRLFPYLI